MLSRILSNSGGEVLQFTADRVKVAPACLRIGRLTRDNQ